MSQQFTEFHNSITTEEIKLSSNVSRCYTASIESDGFIVRISLEVSHEHLHDRAIRKGRYVQHGSLGHAREFTQLYVSIYVQTIFQPHMGAIPLSIRLDVLLAINPG